MFKSITHSFQVLKPKITHSLLSSKNKHLWVIDRNSSLTIGNCYFSTTPISGRLLNKKSAQLMGRTVQRQRFPSSSIDTDTLVDSNNQRESQFQGWLEKLENLSKDNPSNEDMLIDYVDRYINENVLESLLQEQNDSDDNSSNGFMEKPALLRRYSVLLEIKSSIQFRFRRFDEILTNIQNQIYLFDFFNLDSNDHTKTQSLCRDYVYVLLFHDHGKLRKILNTNYALNQNLFEVKNISPTQRGRKLSRNVSKSFKNHSQDQIQAQIEDQDNSKSISTLSKAFKIFMHSNHPSNLLIKSIGFAIIGEFEKCFKSLMELISMKRTVQNISLFLPIYIYWANENYHSPQNRAYSSEPIKQFVKKNLCNSSQTIDQRQIPQYLSPEDSEYLLNSVLSYLHNSPLEWTDLSIEQLGPFSYSIYLIAENYYLNAQKQKGIKIVRDLNDKITSIPIKLAQGLFSKYLAKPGRKLISKKPFHQKTQTSPTQLQINFYQQQKQKQQIETDLRHLITFFQFMKSYDIKDFQYIKSKQQQFSEETKTNFQRTFSIKNDILRSNIYELFSETFQRLNCQDKSDEYATLKIANYCVNDTYEMNQIEETISEEEIKVMDFLREKKQAMMGKRRGIPPHFLPISNPFLTHL